MRGLTRLEREELARAASSVVDDEIGDDLDARADVLDALCAQRRARWVLHPTNPNLATLDATELGRLALRVCTVDR